MAANVASQAGQSQITLFEVVSNYNKPVDFSGGIISLDYYESVLDNSVRVIATFADTGYRKSGNGCSVFEKDDVNLTSAEKVNLKIVDGYDFTLDLTGPKHLRINEIRGIQESNNKMIFTLDFFSKESIDNHLEEYRVKTRFDGKISDSVKKILTEVLQTQKPIDVDSTLNKLSFIGNVEKPFHKLAWLAPRSVPEVPNAKGNLAGFFFYETYDGFKFKSIDKLFEQKPKKKLIYNEIIGGIPPSYDGKIILYSFDSSINLKNTLLTGSHLKTQLKAVNTEKSSYRQSEFNSSAQFNPATNGGKEKPIIGKDLNLAEKTSKIVYKFDDQGCIVEGKNLEEQLQKSREINYNNDEILRQSYSRVNNLFSIKLSIAIAGDLSLRAGDLLLCDFPEVSSKKTRIVSEKKSGIYMIVDVCHHITKNGCYTRLNLVRESIGKKSS